MLQFKNKPEGFNTLRKKIIQMTAAMFVLAIIAVVVIDLLNANEPKVDIGTWLLVGFVLIGVMTYSIYNSIKKQRSLFDSYILIIDNDLIIRTILNTPTVSMPFDDISEILKAENGILTIKGKTAMDLIFISPHIENYDQLEQVLNQIMPIRKATAKSLFQKYGSLLSVLMVGLFVVIFAVDNKIAVSFSAAIFIGLLLWSFFTLRKSKNIDSKTKRSIGYIWIAVASVVAIVVFKWIS